MTLRKVEGGPGGGNSPSPGPNPNPDPFGVVLRNVEPGQGGRPPNVKYDPPPRYNEEMAPKALMAPMAANPKSAGDGKKKAYKPASPHIPR